MKRVAALALLCAATLAVAQAGPPASVAAAAGPAIRRVANMPDGAPAFELLGRRGELIGRIECIWNGWYESDAMAARLLGSTQVMAAVVAKRGRIAIEDLGPATFDCVVVATPPGRVP